MYFTSVNPLSRILSWSFFSGFSSLCINLGMLGFLFKMQVEKKHSSCFSRPVLHHQTIPRITSHMCGCFQIWSSPFVGHKASLDCRGGRRSKSDLSYAFLQGLQDRSSQVLFLQSEINGSRRFGLSWVSKSFSWVINNNTTQLINPIFRRHMLWQRFLSWCKDAGSAGREQGGMEQWITGAFLCLLSQRKEENQFVSWQKSSASSTLFSLTWCNIWL